MAGFIIVDDKRDIRNEMHERMSGRRMNGGYRTSGNREFEEGYREGYEHGFRDHERDMEEHGEYRSTRYGR
jgi:hypothetical protein